MITPKENRVLYILGAGFSAPLGLPVMGNFISRSRDVYFNDTKQYSYFPEVYETIKKLSVIKNTFHADLYNIEEILSLLEMEAFMIGKSLNEQFVHFLSDVIKALLPPMERIEPGSLPGNWQGFIFGRNPLWMPYFELMASMLSLEMNRTEEPNHRTHYYWMKLTTPNRYAIITLNYDTVIEAAFKHVTGGFHSRHQFELNTKNYDQSWSQLQLAKLHGCAEVGNIVPPTWRKGGSAVMDAWKMAFNLIKDANQIRFVGYSLPVSDSYIRYLLKTAIRESQDLKNIDVITYDMGSLLEQRYREFVDFKALRFKNEKLQTFFLLLAERLKYYVHNNLHYNKLPFDYIEHAHHQLFEG